MHKGSYRKDKKQSYFIAMWVCVFLSLLFLISFIRFIPKIKKSHTYRMQAQEEWDALAIQEKELEDKLLYIESKEGQEEIFRQQYGLVRSGESVVVIIDDEEAGVEIKKEKRSFFSFFARLFSRE